LALLSRDEIVIPPIVYYEVKRGLLYKKAYKQLEEFKEFCNSLVLIDNINFETIEKASELYDSLRNGGQIIDECDIFIAAFCLVEHYTLVTNNTKHFEKIKDLDLENWLE